MKQFITIICGFLIATGTYAQNFEDYTIEIQDSVDYDFYEKAQELIEQLDLAEVTSGILYERGFPFVLMDPFKGKSNDTVQANLMTFSLAYASLYSMALNAQARLPEPVAYTQWVDNLNSKSDTVPLIFLHVNYHRFKSYALDSNLLTLSGGRLYDVANRQESPYLNDSIFLVATAKDEVRTSGQVTLTYEPNLWFSNTAKTIQQVAIDFGAGFSDLGAGRAYTHVFDSSGVYPYVVRLTYSDNSVFYSKSYLVVQVEKNQKNTSFTPSYSKPISATVPYHGEAMLPPGIYQSSPYGKGTAHVYLACGHEDIVKPFIWCEGYNPVVGGIDQGLDFSKALLRINYEDENLEKSLLAMLLDEGYDIIVLDYQDGGNYIQRNAYFFVEALKWINEVKREQGSIEKNVVMGQSMGGMVARYGLRWMEVNNIDHETATYISFDTGHQGTNVPIGAQAALRHVSSMPVLGLIPLEVFVPYIRDARRLLDLPASRQMLAYQTYPTAHPFNLHQNYYTEQNVILGMPQNCEILAIANGSQLGTNGAQNFLPAMPLISAASGNVVLINAMVSSSGFQHYYGSSPVVAGIVAGSVGPFITLTFGAGALAFANILAAPLGSGVVYTGVYQVSVLGIPLILSSAIAPVTNMKPIDSSPGGAVNPVLFPEMIQQFTLLPIFNLHAWSFTPVVSTLNFGGGVNNGYNQVYTAAFMNPVQAIQQNQAFGVHHFIANISPTVYNRTDSDGNTYPETVTLNNTLHTFFNPRIAPWFLYHVVGQSVPTSMTSLQGESFNFGKTGIQPESYYQSSVGPVRTQSLLGHSLSIDNDGLLAVNANASIGFSNSGYGITEDNTVFSVRVKGGECADDLVEITVNDGGQLIIGDGDNRQGEMVFYANTKLIINEGGEVIVRKGSSLIVRKEAEIVLNGGRLIVEDEGRLLQRSLGKLTYNQGSEFVLDGHSSIFDTHGWINIGEDATFSIESLGNSKGLMVIRDTEMDYANWGENASIWLIGDGKNDDLIHFEDKGMLLATADSDGTHLKELRIMHCTVKFRESTTMSDAIISSARVLSNHVRFVNENFNRTQLFRVAVTSNFRSCEFENSGIWSYLFNPSHHLRVFNSHFKNNTGNELHGFAIRNERGYVNITHSEFSNCRGAIKTTDLLSNSLLADNKIIGSDEYYSIGVENNSFVELLMRNNRIQKTHSAVRNSNGTLNLLCNTITATKENSISGVLGLIDMSTTFKRGGYNYVQADHGQALISLFLSNLFIDRGLNFVTNSGNLINGVLPWTCAPQSICTFFASRNQWETSLNSPPQNKFSLATANFMNLYVQTAPTALKPECRIFDAGGIIGNPVYSFTNNDLVAIFNSDENERPDLPLIVSPSFNKVRLDIAIQTAMLKMQRMDSLYGDNTMATTLFEEILNDRTAITSLKKNPDLLLVALEGMKYAVEQEIQLDTLGNGVYNSFSLIQNKYAQTLNKWTEILFNKENDYTTFHLEMNKMQMMRLLNKDELALEIILNYELCGLDSIQQLHVNELKKSILMDLSIKKNGKLEAAFDMEIRKVDTTGFAIPTAQVTPSMYFGCEIASPNDVRFTSCVQGKMPFDTGDNIGQYASLYPNPNDGSFTLMHNLNVQEKVVLRIYSLSGTLVHEQAVDSDYIDVTLKNISSGAYYYRLSMNEIPGLSGKLIIN